MRYWQLNLRHLRVAMEIRNLRRINAAAEAVNLTQPAITQALHKLEAQLGLPLFERQSGGMVPTEAAELLAPRIEAALAHILSPRITMTQLRAFLALGEAGSYSGASAAIGLAQPTLHRAVADLSLALRRNLVERRGKGVALTLVGGATLRAFRLAKAELEAGLSELAGLKGIETGHIAIGAMPLSRARVLPSVIAAFYRQHPEVRISIIEGSWQELAESLRDGEIDLMVGAMRPDNVADDLAQRPLFADDPVVIARKGHPLSGVAADVRRLASYPWAVAARGTPLRSGWEGMFRDAGLEPPAVPIECGSVMMIRQILIDSDFLTLLSPDQVAVELEAGWLEIICEAPPGLRRTIGVSTRTGWQPTAKQQAFLDLLSYGADMTIQEKL